jgi:CHAT domain-containing protein
MPGLANLEAAEQEAIQVGSLYDKPLVLVEDGATKQRFQSSVGDYDIIHFSGHAIVNAELFLMSRFVLAPSAGDNGILYAHEVYKLALPRTRLVVLSACSTARGVLSSSEGVQSLARPFLANGVPSVVATLWQADDRSTSDFMLRFHEHLRSGLEVSDALRATQIAMLGSHPRRPFSTWAGFQLIGY